ncbi:MAG: T9SS type A sorting domain-containing protein [Sphingobacteriaceae bacterium]|nr:T9SS type A sorting domain-containing protein [Sphingobacteriaceae bacterium]
MKATLLVRILLLLIISLQLGMLISAQAHDQKPQQSQPIAEKTRIQFNIYPNPTQGDVSLTLNLQKAGTVKITVIDMIGRSISEQKESYTVGSHRIDFSLSGQKAGIYFVEVDSPDGKNSKKLILK